MGYNNQILHDLLLNDVTFQETSLYIIYYHVN